MFGLSIWELLIILLIVMFLFGPKRLANIGSDLGNAIKGFRKAVSEDETQAVKQDDKVIDGSVASSQTSTKQNSDAPSA